MNFKKNLHNYMQHHSIGASELSRKIVSASRRTSAAAERRMRRIVSGEVNLLAVDLFKIAKALDISGEDLCELAYNDFAKKYNLPLQPWLKKDT